VSGDALKLSGGAAAILIGLGVLIVVGLVLRWWVGRHFSKAAREVRPADALPAPDAGSAPDVVPAPDAVPALASNGRARGRRARAPDDPASHGAAAAFLVVLCAVALVLWLENPFAAALLVPALHLWLWIVAPETRLRAPWTVLLFLAGLVPGALAAFYYAAVLGLGPAAAAWNAVLMLAGGSVSTISAIEWSVVAGCVVSLAVMVVRIAREPRLRPAETPITMRGPVTYARAPGSKSLGGTKSALRR
jgi:hypothetical protein